MTNLGHYPMQIHYIEGEKDKDRLNKSIMRVWGIKGKGGVDPEKLPKDIHCAGSGWIAHEHNRGNTVQGVKNFWFGDIRKLKGKDILDALGMKQGDIDVVTGGPPCQGYSKAGNQNINDPRNNLVYEYARMIKELQPRTFIMEEVPDIVNFFDPDGVPVLDKFCFMLEDGGYGKWEMIKKSLLMQAGAAAVIRGQPREKKASHAGKKKSPKKHKKETMDQDELF
jgi:DNA (cytosine-5)-methyltransferase 1